MGERGRISPKEAHLLQNELNGCGCGGGGCGAWVAPASVVVFAEVVPPTVLGLTTRLRSLPEVVAVRSRCLRSCLRLPGVTAGVTAVVVVAAAEVVGRGSLRRLQPLL